MAEKIHVTGKTMERIRDVSATLPRLEVSELAKALGAEPTGDLRPSIAQGQPQFPVGRPGADSDLSEKNAPTMKEETISLIGKILTVEPERDAVHIAVAPVIAAEKLFPGQDVGFLPDGRVGRNPNAKMVGIIDPFLKHSVLTGQRCWLFLYPGSITSLNHVWTHPDFDRDRKE